MIPRGARGTLAAIVVVAALAAAARAAATDTVPPDTDRQFAEAVAALERGAFDDAVDRLEALADGGFVHPDASYDRAVAYLGRAASPQARPGDLGQVVAALAEVVNLRPSDAEAARALDRVRDEIASRRVRAGREPAVVNPALGRAVVGLLGEAVWLVLAAAGAGLLTLGLGARAIGGQPWVRLGAGVTASVGGGLLILAATFALAAGHYRRAARPAVVVVPEARMLGADGTPLDIKSVSERQVAAPEGAFVFVSERRGRLIGVEWGTTRAFVASSDVRVLAAP